MDGLAEGTFLSGRFKLIRRLGSGGGGEVWLAQDNDAGIDVALKFPAPPPAGPAPDMLRAACERAARLSHPGIVSLKGVFDHDGRPFLAMQSATGGDLSALRGSAWREIVANLLPVCDALEYAHAQGLVHRDLKPANVLRDARGRPLLADFDIAAAAGDAGAPRGGGSLPYASPQQLDGAPPAIADDVYGLGALLYDLLHGAPPFHPGATAARVRAETPPGLARDGAGELLPPELARLVAAMLDKSPERRPAGIAACRAVLEDMLAGAGPIRPARRERDEAPDGEAPISFTPRRSQGLPAGIVYGGLAASLLLVLAVIFWLPRAVEQRAPAAPAATTAAAPEPAPAIPAADPAMQRLAEEALGEVLELDRRLVDRGVALWGGADWESARALSADGDAKLRARDWRAARDAYLETATAMRALDARVPAVLDAALAAGAAALADGRQSEALDAYRRALAIDKDNAAARRGLARAETLDRVLAAMEAASASEAAGKLAAARDGYRAALELDGDWQPARDALARVGARLGEQAYEARMAEGYAALAAREHAAARRAFERALAARPGDAAAAEGVAQASAEARTAEIARLVAEGAALAAREDWPAAVQAYRRALELDPGVSAAKTGLAEAESRARLDASLDEALARSGQFNDDRLRARAAALLAEGRRVAAPGPLLSGRLERLARAIEIASTPVPVRFESDNLTDVVIYKVGRLGTFGERVVPLRPGSYVAVGSRNGYRDVRREFMVEPDGGMPPVVVRCEVPI